MKMLIGFIFCLGMIGVTVYNSKKFGLLRTIMSVVVEILASILFLGKFISEL